MTGKITIEGKEYPLRFGMSVVRALALTAGQVMNEEDERIFIIWQGHLCYCSSRQMPPMLEYYQVVDFVEMALATKNAEQTKQINDAVMAYNSSTIIKDLLKEGNEILKQDEEDKKKLSSQTMSASPTENLGSSHGSLTG